MSLPLLRMAGDERLARLVTAGNDPAFALLYDRYRDVLVRYCRSLLRDDQDALDAFQSTMLNALRALREDRRRAPVRPWLFRIAHNESVSVLRRRPVSEPLDDRQVAAHDVHRTAEGREALAGLLEDLGALTDHQRGALLLRELGGLGYDDVAEALDTTPLAARQAVFAARSSLHDQREGRELPCAMVQRRLSDADRRAARTRAVRAHLRRCDDCRDFASAIGRRRRAAVLIPVPPAFASGGLLMSILDGGGGASAGAGGGALAAGAVAKTAAALSAAVVATGAAERPKPVHRHATAQASAAVVPATVAKPTPAAKPAATTVSAPTAKPAPTRRSVSSSVPKRDTSRHASAPVVAGDDLGDVDAPDVAPTTYGYDTAHAPFHDAPRGGEGRRWPHRPETTTPTTTTTAAPAPVSEPVVETTPAATTAAPAETTTSAPAETTAVPESTTTPAPTEQP